MGKEIERKFIVGDNSYKDYATSVHQISQGYVSTEVNSTVRIRIKDERAFLTLKGRNEGMSRGEWEYEIPLHDGREMMKELCGDGRIEKSRYIVPFEGLTWEVDEFHGVLEGLVMAEVEFESEDVAICKMPPFVKKEVTNDPRYYNSQLIRAKERPVE